jgi:hypothetical protein
MVLGSGIRDPGSGKNLFRIQGSKSTQSRIRIRNTGANGNGLTSMPDSHCPDRPTVRVVNIITTPRNYS